MYGSEKVKTAGSAQETGHNNNMCDLGCGSIAMLILNMFCDRPLVTTQLL